MRRRGRRSVAARGGSGTQARVRSRTDRWARRRSLRRPACPRRGLPSGSAPALVELANLAELVGVRPLLVLPGHFEERGQLLQLGMREEDAELFAELAFADV